MNTQDCLIIFETSNVFLHSLFVATQLRILMLCVKQNQIVFQLMKTIDIAKAKKITDKHNIAIGGNIQLTVTMLHGSQTDNMKAVVDIIESVDNLDNLIIAPGCDMPYDTPIENIIGISQAVNDYEHVKESLKDYEKSLNLDGHYN